MIELKNKRKRREKHYLKKDGTITAYLYDQDIHYLKNNQYEEIDNKLISKKNYITNKSNDFKTYFSKTDKLELMKVKDGNKYLTMFLKEVKDDYERVVSNNELIYQNILDDIDIKYQVLNSKVKETIILKNKNNLISKIVFQVKTNLELVLEKEKILAKSKDKTIFTLELPYMFDSNNIINNNLKYNLITLENSYEIELLLDTLWLNQDNILFPVMVDPTITNQKESNSVYDTYIYEGDTNVDRNSQDILKIGVEREDNVDKVYRTLIKFDLPTIGTGDEIIEAKVNLYSHYNNINKRFTPWPVIAAHQITESWDEETANWSNMHDKFNPLLEEWDTMSGSSYDEDGSIVLNINDISITNLIKKWYTGTPNYGVMLKQHDEVYYSNINKAHCMSKNHNLTDGNDPKPFLSITYQNQNGLESYLSYSSNTFTDGCAYINNYNGNLTTIFNICSTISGKLPASLSIAYNTNDIILNNNYGYEIGYKLSLHQTVEEITIEDNDLLKYIDEDATIHYFTKIYQSVVNEETGATEQVLSDEYYDEDGLSLTIYQVENDYVMKDNNGNQYLFVKSGDLFYLKEVTDVSNNKIIINYVNNKIASIIDANNQRIDITYNTNQIVIESPNDAVYLNYSNGLLSNIITKNGSTFITYNANNIISRITDTTGLSTNYEYYDVIPYRMKKISEYSVDNNLGKSLTFNYDFKTTTIVDNKNRYNTYVFNERGNLISLTNLDDGEEVKDAYGTSNSYGEMTGTINRLITSGNVNKYVNNLLTDVSFEEETFSFNSQLSTIMISDEEARTGSKSLKIVSLTNDEETYKNLVLTKDNYYTFSVYVKNDNTLKLMLSYNEGLEVIESVSKLISSNSEFNRYDVTIYYSEEATSSLKLSILSVTSGTIYIDDIQLEVGEVANYHNLIDNSNFINGMNGFEVDATRSGLVYYNNIMDVTYPTDTYEIVTLSNGYNAIRLKSDPFITQKLTRNFNIEGKAYDMYIISFWYKHSGSEVARENGYDRVLVKFYYKDTEMGHGEFLGEQLRVSPTNWQYYSYQFIAEKDFDRIEFIYFNLRNINDIYLTNFSLFKDLENNNYGYDDSGNLNYYYSQSQDNVSFNYDNNNQLINSINSKGSKFTYEYDNVITDRLLAGLSPLGIINKITYDENNNPIKTMLTNVREDKDNLEGIYYIRAKGTDKYLTPFNNTILLEEDSCSHQMWDIIKVEDDYQLKIALTNKYLTRLGSSLKLTAFNNDFTLFTLVLNDNGSYGIKVKDNDLYLTVNNDTLVLQAFIEDDYHQQFFIEDAKKDLFIESRTEYTADGKFVNKKIDSLGNTINYDVNQTNGLINSITDALDRTTNYTYNTKNQITSISNNNITVNYEYNTSDILSKITQGNREYNFIYDEFLNTKEIKIGNDITLITNNYESNNGNLYESIYGNNDYITYTYDEFDRLKQTNKMDNSYTYYYDNFNNISKIETNNDLYHYYYDFASQVSSYSYNDFIINYEYDKSNIISKSYELSNIKEEVNYTYDLENSITNISYDNDNLNYIYDKLGRLKEQNINDIFKTEYKYITKGRQTSLLLESIKDNYNDYKYTYDKVSNITSISNNDNLIKEYVYDDLNQLSKEYDYINSIIKEYSYDIYGNLLDKKEYDLETNTLLQTDTYEYNNNLWTDQLTKYNNTTITYDNIGNPLTIGNDVSLSYINGRELSSYSDLNTTITYKYNKDGIRIEKEVNNVKSSYYVENSQIIIEKRDINVIYYLREVNNKLLGFKYNNDMYYYLKNGMEDIIGILDDELNLIVNYEYDSWGKVVSVKDNNGIVITNQTHIGHINPFRYRSYYYDTETGLYYLNSRYYNPEWGRFINEDNYVSTDTGLLGHNMYSYCNNNSIKNIDSNGHFILIGLVVGIVAVGAVAVAIAVNTKIQNNKAKEEIEKVQQKSNVPDKTEDLNEKLKQSVNEIKKETKNKNFVEKLKTFSNAVTDNSEYDLKSGDEWNTTISYNGIIMEPQDIGNFHYGYVGRSIGIPITVLLGGAGYNQLTKLNLETLRNCFSLSVCDDPRDSYYIKMGAIKYDSQN
ncbi:MAG: DNRLRE domain-containing protein [Bacilli bacterium]|nr:DNRLRE domain-containing protein [Bacilli bacterium]